MALWVPGAVVPDNRPVYVRAVDRASLLDKLSEKGSPCPCVVEVQPNGEAALPLLEFLKNIGGENAPTWLVSQLHESAVDKGRLEQLDPLFDCSGRIAKLDQLRGARLEEAKAEFRPLLRAACDVVISLHACSAAALIQAANTLESAAIMQQGVAAESCHPFTTSLAKFLQALGEQLMLPMEQGLLYCHDNNEAYRRNWWIAQPYLSQTCIKLRREVQSIGAPEPPPVVRKMQDWLHAMEVQLNQMSLSKAGGKHRVVFETASAWFTAAALRHMERAHAGWGLLFLHRAVEWLMMAKAADKGFIDFSKHGGQYRPQYVGSGERSGFSVHLDALNGNVNFFGLLDSFKDLNSWRNLLPYTHNMTVAPDDRAYTLISKIFEKLPKFAASADWIRAVKIFTKSPPVEFEDLVDPDGLLRSSINIIE